MRFLIAFIVALTFTTTSYYEYIRYVDPYGDFGSEHFPAVVLDSRREKINLFKQFQKAKPVDGLILGSSRSLLLRPDALDPGRGERFFNFAVENAHTEDFLAIYRYVRSLRAAPRILVVAIDIPSLHIDNIPDPMFDRSALKEAIQGSRVEPEHPWLHALEGFKAFFTKDYLKDSFKAVSMGIRHVIPQKSFARNGYEMSGSGTALPEGRFDPAADHTEDFNSYMQRLNGMTDLSPARKEYLAQLVSDARRDKCKVIFWLTPIHPSLHRKIKKESNYSALLSNAKLYLQGLATQDGVRYVDLSAAEVLGASDSGWYDSTHMDWRNMDRVARYLTDEILHGF